MRAPWETAVFWSMFATGLRVGGIVVVLPLIVRLIPSQELGLWYIFLASTALGVLVDAGFGSTVTRSAGYAWGGAEALKSFGHQDAESGSLDPNRILLKEITGAMSKYYRNTAAIYFLLMAGVGSYYIFYHIPDSPSSFSMVSAWAVFCLGSAVNFSGSLWPALLAGINGVKTGQLIFVRGLLINYGLLVIGLLSGLGLWALVLSQFVQGFYIRWQGKRRYLEMSGISCFSGKSVSVFNLLKTLWPMAWRSLAISAGAYGIIQANTLICGSHLGLMETASYGLTLQVITAIVGLSHTWINVKIPLINQCRVRGDIPLIRSIFFIRLICCWGTFLIGGTCLYFFGQYFLLIVGAKTLILEPAILFTLLAIFFLEANHTCFAFLTLTQNHNPFVIPALVSGAAVIGLSLFLVPRYGIWGLVISQGLVQLSFNNWWCVLKGLKTLR